MATSSSSSQPPTRSGGAAAETSTEGSSLLIPIVWGATLCDSDSAAPPAAPIWDDHVHSDDCGHQLIKHGDHYDFLRGKSIIHIHDGHEDVHGRLALPTSPPRKGAEARQAPSGAFFAPLSGGAFLRRRNQGLVDAAHVRTANGPLLEVLATGPKRAGWWRDLDALRFLLMLFLSASFMIVELTVGITIGSLALQTDAYHLVRGF